MLVTKQVSQGEGPTIPVGTQHTPTIIEASPHLQNITIIYRKTMTKTGRMSIRIPQSNVPLIINSSKEEEASLDHEYSPKQGRMIEEIDKDENVNLVKCNVQGEAHETAEHKIDLSTSQTDDETLAETLLNIKRSAAKDKGKAIMQESESPKKNKKKEMM
uniref:Uncharacterized protein n=1 Tax=Tanacetum cinerariifolium TaxID=118510 RepID=A0A699KC03_TANCI|nr:hypothetical protein [Tanacetum cinerariifolium]